MLEAASKKKTPTLKSRILAPLLIGKQEKVRNEIRVMVMVVMAKFFSHFNKTNSCLIAVVVVVVVYFKMRR